MLKVAAVGVAALFMATSPFGSSASAQGMMQRDTGPGTMGSGTMGSGTMGMMQRPNAAELDALTDMRIDLIKSALQLTPEQQRLWPAVEEAIRMRAKNREARLEQFIETTGARAQETPIEALRNRDPIAFLNRRADALAQRSADLKQLSSAWQPLYATLTPEQKRRMVAVSLFVLHDMSNAIENRRMQLEDEEDY